MTYLDSMTAQGKDVILGGMFFQNFFGVFDNNYTLSAYDPTQTAKMYVSAGAYSGSYIGNEELSAGVNPFVPAPPSPDPTPEDDGLAVVWIVILVLLGVLLLAFLGFSIYRCKLAQVQGDRTLVYNNNMSSSDNEADIKLLNRTDEASKTEDTFNIDVETPTKK